MIACIQTRTQTHFQRLHSRLQANGRGWGVDFRRVVGEGEGKGECACVIITSSCRCVVGNSKGE